MSAINLEHLLLESIDKRQDLSYRKLIYFDNKCFLLIFSVAGKTLTVKDIQKLDYTKRPNAKARFHKRWRNLRTRYLRHRSIMCPNTTLEKSSSCELLTVCEKSDNCMQTESLEYCNRGTYTSKLVKRTLKKTQESQTKQTFGECSSKAIQTESEFVAREVQTERNEYHKGCQTDEFQSQDNSIQVQPNSSSTSIQTDDVSIGPVEQSADVSVEQQSLVYMLNEIGEVTMNQLEVSEKNMDVSMNVFNLMKKMVNAQKLQLRIIQPLTKLESLFALPKLLLNESTQTDSCYKDDKGVQTQTIQSRWIWRR